MCGLCPHTAAGLGLEHQAGLGLEQHAGSAGQSRCDCGSKSAQLLRCL